MNPWDGFFIGLSTASAFWMTAILIIRVLNPNRSSGDAMTDNEKAATFIGWAPQRCKEIPNVSGLGPHRIAAPDMSEPENCMRALEHSSISSCTIRYERSPDELDDKPAHWFCWIIYGDWIDEKGTAHGYDVGRVGMVRGETIVEALAALYDAEHTNG